MALKTIPGLVWSSLLITAVATASEHGAARRVLADFELPERLRIEASGARFVVVEHDGGKSLEISTSADQDYPSVFIRDPGGPWDLSGFDAVEMDVYNPQDKPVRVLLSVNNRDADGRRGCNCESIECRPGARMTLTVPFGIWHGNPSNPIDLKNVDSIQILLDRPRQPHRFIVDRIRAVSLPMGPSAEITGNQFFQQLRPAFGRGINLGNALEAPREGEWGVVLKEQYFRIIKDAGFEHVRIPVRWSAHAEQAPPYRIDEKFAARVEWAVQQALDQGLAVVLNVHHYDELMRQPDQHRARFIALWRQISERFQRYPKQLAFELCNEPHNQLTAEKWNDMLAEALKAVRVANPDRTVVIGPVGWNNVNELPKLSLPKEDRNIVVTFHYYDPFHFTHQGAGWVGAEADKWLGTRWSGTAAERLAVCRDLNRAIEWAVKNERPIYMGEFGAYSRADMESRVRWTRFVADEAIARRIGFAYWEFCSGFGAYDAQKEEWIAPLRDALVPTPKK